MQAQRFGRYELLTRLAAGGMAEVFVARVLSALDGVDKMVVVKRLLPDHATNQDYIDMFLDEARTAASLNHPNVVQMYDCGVEAGRHFIAMEYLHGEDLRGILRALKAHDQQIPIEVALQIGISICAGLHHAHEATDRTGKPLGIVHRDISPHNVLVTFDGAVRVVDFGIAKSTNRRSETRHGTIKGKVPYMSPEQLRSDGALDRRSDVYAIGVVLYELLLRQRPYVLANTGEFALMVAIARGDIRTPGSVKPTFPKFLEKILLRAMAHDVGVRYPTAQALQQDLEQFARTEGLEVSATRTSQFLLGLFGERVEAWREAQGNQQQLLAQVVATVERKDDDDEPEANLPTEARPSTNPAPATSYGIEATQREAAGLHVWTLTGRLTEAFQGAALGQDLQGAVLLDLGGIDRLTSFGVREWLAMLEASRRRVTALSLARCSEAFVNQLSMIRALSGEARIVSFFAPYVCAQCGRAFRHLLDAEYDADAIRAGRLPQVPCASCGGSADLDDDPGYLVCLHAHLGLTPPPAVRLVLDAMARDAVAGSDVEKTIEGKTTRIKIRRPLDRSLRWARILDGVEGDVVLDLSEAGRGSGDGARSLTQSLRGLSAEITTLHLEGAPVATLASLDRIPDRVDVASVSFDGRCVGCGGPRASLLTARALRETLESDAPLAFPCRRCGTPLEGVEADLALRALFPDLPARSSHTPGPTTQQAPPPLAAPEPLPAGLPAGLPAPPPVGHFMRNALVLGAVVGGVALGLLAMRTRPLPAAAASAAPATAAPAIPAAPAPGVDQETVVTAEGARVSATGEGATEEEALLDARARALVKLAGLVRQGLRSAPLRSFLDDQLRTGEAPAALVAARWLRLAGTVATPERVEVKIARLGPRPQATARYALGADALARATAVFDRTLPFGGAFLGVLFPLVAGPGDGGVVVVEVPAASAAGRSGLQRGDVLLRIDDQPVPTLDAVALTLADPVPHKSWQFTVQRGSEQANVKVIP
jgi:serine/threonine protein kinase/DNA-directed RNA polymerase subunit RPC12/RpoP